MSKWRDFAPGTAFPSTWTDGIEELVSNYVSPTFQLVIATSTTLQVPAGTNNDQAAIGIQSKPHWVSAPVTAAHPGGAAGAYDVYVTANADSIGTDANGDEQDNTNRAFGLKVLASGGTPSGSGAEAVYRKVGVCTWSGSAITGVQQLVGAAHHAGLARIGAMQDYAGGGDPDAFWLLCDGRELSRANYPALFAVIGTTYGTGDGSTTFNLPDYRGRKSVAPDDMGTAKGDAARRTASRTRGASGGAEKHTHWSVWPFSENGGGGNFVAAIRSSDQSPLTSGASYPALRRLRSGFAAAYSMLAKLNNAGSAAADAGQMGPYNSVRTDIADVYESRTTSDNSDSPYLVANKIIRVK